MGKDQPDRATTGTPAKRTPARGYSWPPFAPGHEINLKHGARSKRILQPIAARLTAELAETAPWTARPAFAAEVTSWAWAEARCVVLRNWIDEHGLVSDEALLAVGDLGRAEVRAASARDRLGLNPLALAKLLATVGAAVTAGADGADALDLLRAEGARIIDARIADDQEDESQVGQEDDDHVAP